ncbi:hypothetical protein BOW31_12730, partial [Solemya velum gill symbiont]|uniref:hypothetical protein n=1 Tax=Solemya velum gill symbiont TaxID=2340 RepID=UPI0009D1E143
MVNKNGRLDRFSRNLLGILFAFLALTPAYAHIHIHGGGDAADDNAKAHAKLGCPDPHFILGGKDENGLYKICSDAVNYPEKHYYLNQFECPEDYFLSSAGLCEPVPVDPPLDCESNIGNNVGVTGTGDTPASACISGCSFVTSGIGLSGINGEFFSTMTFTGSSCSPNDADYNIEDPEYDCTSDEQGQQLCIIEPLGVCPTGALCILKNADGTGSAEYSDVVTHTADIKQGNCVSYGNQGYVCNVTGGYSGSSPPLPNDGTEGSAATPTASFTTTAGDYEFFNSDASSANTANVGDDARTSGA